MVRTVPRQVVGNFEAGSLGRVNKEGSFNQRRSRPPPALMSIVLAAPRHPCESATHSEQKQESVSDVAWDTCPASFARECELKVGHRVLFRRNFGRKMAFFVTQNPLGSAQNAEHVTKTQKSA